MSNMLMRYVCIRTNVHRVPSKLSICKLSKYIQSGLSEVSHLAPLVMTFNASLSLQLEPKKQLKVEPEMTLLAVQTVSLQMRPDYNSI